MASTPHTFRIPENALVPLTFSNTSGQDVDGQTVTLYAVDPSDRANPISLGTGTGAAAGTAFSVTCDFSSCSVGTRYELQGAADVGGANPVVVIPNGSTPEIVYAEVYSMDIF